MNRNTYYDFGLQVLPVYDFTISVRDGLSIFDKIGKKGMEWGDDFMSFKPIELVKVNYQLEYNNQTVNTYMVIYAPQNEDFNNLTLNAYYKIYGVDKEDTNLVNIINNGYTYLVPRYQNMTSTWWWIANPGNNQEYNKLYFIKSTQTDGTGIEPNVNYTYRFINTEIVTTEDIQKLNLRYA